jgi:hypothetical protein
MKFGFKIHLDEVARKLVNKGFSSRQIESEELTNAVLEILQDEYDLFTALEEEFEKIENVPQTKTEYDESIGEF